MWIITSRMIGFTEPPCLTLEFDFCLDLFWWLNLQINKMGTFIDSVYELRQQMHRLTEYIIQ